MLLLQLPTEVRLSVFEYRLRIVHFTLMGKPNSDDRIKRIFLRDFRRTHPLAFTCKQIQSEILHLLVTKNLVVFNIPTRDPSKYPYEFYTFSMSEGIPRCLDSLTLAPQTQKMLLNKAFNIGCDVECAPYPFDVIDPASHATQWRFSPKSIALVHETSDGEGQQEAKGTLQSETSSLRKPLGDDRELMISTLSKFCKRGFVLKNNKWSWGKGKTAIRSES